MLKMTRKREPSIALPSAALLISILASLTACAPLDQSRRGASGHTFWGYSPVPAVQQPSGHTFWGYTPVPAAQQPSGRTFWGYSPLPAAQQPSGHTFWGYAPPPAPPAPSRAAIR